MVEQSVRLFPQPLCVARSRSVAIYPNLTMIHWRSQISCLPPAVCPGNRWGRDDWVEVQIQVWLEVSVREWAEEPPLAPLGWVTQSSRRCFSDQPLNACIVVPLVIICLLLVFIQCYLHSVAGMMVAWELRIIHPPSIALGPHYQLLNPRHKKSKRSQNKTALSSID